MVWENNTDLDAHTQILIVVGPVKYNFTDICGYTADSPLNLKGQSGVLG